MRYASVCSGIEAASLAWEPLGWKPVFFSEVEPFPCAVLAHHWPDVPNLGDMTKIDGRDWRGKADVLVGGTPCQAFSVAGMRKGLHDDRGNLTLIFAELANDIFPDFVVWENVPGVLSDKTNAFGCLLGALAGEDGPLLPPGGKWTNAGYVLGPERTIAWRVLDAQYTGVAQRRRRVFLVACPRNGADPREVLFESEGLRRDTPPRREAGKEITGDVAGCLGAGDGNRGWRNDLDQGAFVPVAFGGNNCSGPIDVATARSSSSPHGRLDFETETFCVTGATTHALTRSQKGATEDGTGRGTPIVPVALHPTQDPISSEDGTTHADTCESPQVVAFRVHGEHSTAMTGNGVARVADPVEVSRCLDSCGGYATNQGGTVVAFTQNQCGGGLGTDFDCDGGLTVQAFNNTGQGWWNKAETAATVRKGDERGNGGARESTILALTQNQCGDVLTGEVCASLGTNQNATGRNTAKVNAGMQVRRLTPRECERLQGMPRDHTLIPWRGKPAELCPDGVRYKSIGNSMAVPCMAWIGKRIDEIVKRKNTNG